ncbi:MAG: HPr-rel-A system PqqD family peptide chaperone [Sedimenticola sp.]
MSESDYLRTWQLDRGIKLLWHDWESEFLVYNETSGATHLLESATATLLRKIEQQQQTFHSLEKLCGEFFQDVPPEEISEWLHETLRQFEGLGLIREIKNRPSAA